MDLMIFLQGGNEAVQTPEDFANILRRIALKLGDGSIPFGMGTANLTDANGNTIGFLNCKESEDGDKN